jgi:hypothetical protein
LGGVSQIKENAICGEEKVINEYIIKIIKNFIKFLLFHERFKDGLKNVIIDIAP